MRLDVDSARRAGRPGPWASATRGASRSTARRAALYVGDVGQNEWEEIDYVPKGASHLNFGWNRYEGNEPYGSDELLPGWTLTPPLHVYDHGTGCSVTGGYVYRGAAVPAAVGRYFFGDYCSGSVWSLRVGTAPRATSGASRSRSGASARSARARPARCT